MRYKYFGKTGEKVSVLGYGNMRLPVVNGDYSQVDESAAIKLVLYALDKGVNYLDTAWPYHGGVFMMSISRLALPASARRQEGAWA